MEGKNKANVQLFSDRGDIYIYMHSNKHSSGLQQSSDGQSKATGGLTNHPLRYDKTATAAIRPTTDKDEKRGKQLGKNRYR